MGYWSTNGCHISRIALSSSSITSVASHLYSDLFEIRRPASFLKLSSGGQCIVSSPRRVPPHGYWPLSQHRPRIQAWYWQGSVPSFLIRVLRWGRGENSDTDRFTHPDRLAAGNRWFGDQALGSENQRHLRESTNGWVAVERG